jgi:DNA-binding CsgD family transcriptional regulator
MIPRGDVKVLLRIVGEVGELADDSHAWRTHMLERLARHLGGRIGMSITGPLPHLDFFNGLHARTNAVRGDPVVGFGWSATERESVLGALRDFETSGDPTLPFVSKVRNRSYTATRQQMVSNRDWYTSDHVEEKRHANGIDSFIISQVQVPGCGWHVFGIHRAWGDKPVGERERVLLELLHAELAELWRRNGVTGGPPARNKLSPRLRTVFDLLCQGHVEKEIAATMNLSQHTVHDYVKELHRRLRVRGRGELLALAIGQSRGRSAPVW